MKKLAAVLLTMGIGIFALAPAASALDLNLLDGGIKLDVKVLEPDTLVDVDLDADVDVLPTLPVLSDPLVHVCVDGQIQSVLASVAANLHLDVLGSDNDCKPTTVTTTPPSANDPLVHVCVNGTVQSVLASVAANLHLDILGSDVNCTPPPTTGPPTTPPGNDPLVHVCVDGKVQSLLASVALNLHLDVLGVDQKCPVPPGTPGTPTTPTEPPTTVGTPVGPPAPGPAVTNSTDTSAPVVDVKAEPTAKKKTGPLAFTGNGWVQLLAGLGLAALIAGLLFKYLGRK